MQSANRSIWIMGCGDIGRRVARLYQKQAIPTIGWVASDHSVTLGQAQGIEMRQGDMDAGSFFPRNAFADKEIFWFSRVWLPYFPRCLATFSRTCL